MKLALRILSAPRQNSGFVGLVLLCFFTGFRAASTCVVSPRRQRSPVPPGPCLARIGDFPGTALVKMGVPPESPEQPINPRAL